jgi:pilus assembly protein CpaE
MIASDDAARLQHYARLLALHGSPVSEGMGVPLSMAADRASRTEPDVLLLELSGDVDLSLATLRETRQTSNVYIIAIGPAHDPRFILRCLHDGADEFLDLAQIDVDLTSALARFKAKTHARARQGGDACKVISVLGSSGGVGATTIAANVAGGLAKAHGKCGLIDLRLQTGDLSALLNLRPPHTLWDFCANAGRVDQTMLTQMFARHSSGVELMPAPWDATQAELVTAQNLRLLLALARRNFPYILMDVDNRPGELPTEALWQSDLILVVTRLDYLSVRNGRRLLERLTEMGFEGQRVRVVANRFGQPRELPIAEAQLALGVKVENFVRDDASRINRCANEGQLAASLSSWFAISRQLNSLAAAVNGRAK